MLKFTYDYVNVKNGKNVLLTLKAYCNEYAFEYMKSISVSDEEKDYEEIESFITKANEKYKEYKKYVDNILNILKEKGFERLDINRE